MKITRFLLSLLLFGALVQSCQNDITDTGDPRDAIAKKWRVTDNSGTGTLGYDVTISKDANETTRVLLSNFHNLGTTDKLNATIAGKTLTVASQVLDGTYTISGTGTIASDSKSISFTYSVKEGADPAHSFTASFNPPNVVKKKAVANQPAL